MRSFKITKSITNRDDEIFRIYLRDVSHRPLISQDEEIELAKKIQQGDKKALDKLVTSNLRFVISVAKQYQNSGIPLVDLINSGNEGLIHAATLFDYTKGFKFISYAVWWIRQSIIQSLSYESRTIRIPVSQNLSLSKIHKVMSEYEQKYERLPSEQEIADILNVSVDKIFEVLSGNLSCISVETPFSSDDESGCLLDVIENKNAPASDIRFKKEDMYKNLDILLSKFTNREADILVMSFGLKGIQPLPFDEIGKRFGLTGERVRQIKECCIDKIKKNYLYLAKELL